MSSQTLSWSYSRVDVFTRCRLEYYYAYYGAYGGWEKDAPKEKRELNILKHTKNRYAWMGDMVHGLIEEFMQEFAKGNVLSSEQFLERADQRMRREYRDSRDQLYRKDPGRYNGLVEHENNIAVTDQQWKHIHENVMGCAANFFYTDFYKQHIATGGRDILRIEKLDSFDLDGIKVYARPDVAIKGPDFLKIIDWKTGSENDEHEFQLCYYVLYGVRKLGVSPDKIKASLVYLKDNTQTEAVMDASKLERAAEYLKSTFEGIETFAEEARQGVEINALPRAKAKSTCSLCRFQKICAANSCAVS
jgi:hypothetical protein